MFFKNREVILGGSLIVTSAIAGITAVKYFKLRKKLQEKNVYETNKSVNEYLLLHYGIPSDSLLFDFELKNAFDFPVRCADLCIRHKPNSEIGSRALDVGCAVGRSTYQLTKGFNEVIGIDYSKKFIDTCNELKKEGCMAFSMTTEGLLSTKYVASVGIHVDRSQASFRVGDACCLDADLENFTCVLAANLICRLADPAQFLLRCATLVAKGGILVITSPYTFMTEFTPEDKMIGGVLRDGREVTGFDGLRRILSTCFELIAEEDLPFLIRETRRKHQLTVAHATVWRRK